MRNLTDARRGRFAGFSVSAAGALISCTAQAQSAPTYVDPSQQNLARVAVYVARICADFRTTSPPTTTLQGALFDRCRRIVNETSPDAIARNAIDQITPQEMIAQDAAIGGSVSAQTLGVAARMSAMSHFAMGGDALAMAFRPIELADASDEDASNAAASAIANQGRLQAFGSATYAGGRQRASALESGFGVDLESATLGLDMRASPTVTLGIAGAYGHTKLDFSNNNGSLRTQAWTGSGYVLIQPSDRLELSTLLAYSQVSYNSRRPVSYQINFVLPTGISGTDAVNGTAFSRTHASQFEITTNGFYNLGKGDWTFGPAVQASYTHLHINKFQETGSTTEVASLAFQFGDQNAESLLLSLGLDVTRPFSTNAGIVSPYFRIRGMYEALDNRRLIAIRYINGPSAPTASAGGINLVTTSPDRDRYSISAGVAAQFSSGVSGFIDAQTLLGLQRVRQYALTVGLRIEL